MKQIKKIKAKIRTNKRVSKREFFSILNLDNAGIVGNLGNVEMLESAENIVKKKYNLSLNFDLLLFFVVLLLTGVGLAMVYSASSAFALNKYGIDYYFFKKQIIYAGIGFVLLIIFKSMPIKWLYKSSYLMLLVSIVLLIFTLSPLGITVNGSRRWLKVFSFQFQTYEIARFALITFLAYSISKKQNKIYDFSVGFLPHGIILGFMCLLIIKQPDYGSVVILAVTAWIMMFLGNVPVKNLFLTLVPLIPIGVLIMMSKGYRMDRIDSFFDPWKYASTKGYQAIHSLMAFGSGGFFGSGIGQSLQKLFYLPESHTDFVFSIIGEEMGFIGVAVIIGLYIIIISKGFLIARDCTNTFTFLLASGITVTIGLQACINMCVTLSLLPTKGLTLPFLSYGGTSLIINMCYIGVLMNIGAMNERR